MPACPLCRNSFEGDRCPVCGYVAARQTARPRPQAVLLPARRDSLRVESQRVVEGTVIQTHGPAHVPAPADPWRWFGALLLFIALLPVIVAVGMVVFAIRLAFWVLGFRNGRMGGRSLLDELLIHHLLQTILRRPEQVPVYHHVVETDAGHVLVRQQGEFRDGRVFVGNRVRLTCRPRRGALVIEDGVNETLQATLSPDRSPWKAISVALVVVVVVEYCVLLGGAGLWR